jgi:uncharacterized membrane protein YfcA
MITSFTVADFMADFLILAIPFLVVAFLYASVGHGGASGYLALMSIFMASTEHVKPIALILNLVVSGIAFFRFYRQKYFVWRLFLPIAVLSIPMAFLGGLTPLKEALYLKSLGVFLLVSVLLLNRKKTTEVETEEDAGMQISGGYHRWVIASLLGGVIGYLSGLLGIGGGILLSPILLLLGWTQQKQTAALSAAFIFVNSISGLFGSIQQHPIWVSPLSMTLTTHNEASLDVYWINVLITAGTLILPVVLGGVLGSGYGAKKFNQQTMKYILSVVLLIAAIKLLL